MYCPQCSQQQSSDEMRFCSRCGFPLDGVTKLVTSGGNLSALEETGKLTRSPRRKGIEQGVILIFISILLLPLVGIISQPYHEVLIFLFLLGGILRALYALVFQEGALFNRLEQKENDEPLRISENKTVSELSPAEPVTLNFPQKVKTAEFVELPDSVTDNTTKLLNKNSKLSAD